MQLRALFFLFYFVIEVGMKECSNLEYVHMRGEMNSYRFEISNRRENKFCSQWSFISAGFQNDPIFWWTCVGISFQVVFTWYWITRNEISFLSVTDMKSIPALSIKRTCALNATSNESALIRFVSGKLCSHENLMLVWNFILVKMTDMKSIPFWVSFRLI